MTTIMRLHVIIDAAAADCEEVNPVPIFRVIFRKAQISWGKTKLCTINPL
jgi:hypothetical protein